MFLDSSGVCSSIVGTRSFSSAFSPLVGRAIHGRKRTLPSGWAEGAAAQARRKHTGAYSMASSTIVLHYMGEAPLPPARGRSAWERTPSLHRAPLRARPCGTAGCSTSWWLAAFSYAARNVLSQGRYRPPRGLVVCGCLQGDHGEKLCNLPEMAMQDPQEKTQFTSRSRSALRSARPPWA